MCLYFICIHGNKYHFRPNLYYGHLKIENKKNVSCSGAWTLKSGKLHTLRPVVVNALIVPDFGVALTDANITATF